MRSVLSHANSSLKTTNPIPCTLSKSDKGELYRSKLVERKRNPVSYKSLAENKNPIPCHLPKSDKGGLYRRKSVDEESGLKNIPSVVLHQYQFRLPRRAASKRMLLARLLITSKCSIFSPRRRHRSELCING
jgi:hypothetical protein